MPATCEQGPPFRFGNRASGGWRYGQVDAAQKIPVAKAVAASAACPLILPPLLEKFSFTRGGKHFEESVVLIDGGVFDNLGVSVLEPGRDADISINVHKPDYIICLNASVGQLEGTDRPTWWPARVKRSSQTVHRKAQDSAYGRLHRYIESGELKGFVMVYLGQDDNRLPVKPPDLVPRSAGREQQPVVTDIAPLGECDHQASQRDLNLVLGFAIESRSSPARRGDLGAPFRKARAMATR
jgi:NTE family protein